jgi:hypothetical protein
MSTPLGAYPDLEYASTDAISLIQQMRSLSTDTPQNIVLKAAFAGSIKTVWAVMCGLAGLALVLSVFIKEYDLNVAISSDQGFVDRKKVNKGVRVSGLVEVDPELMEQSGSDSVEKTEV